jgi:hypothetical protein
VSGSNASKHHTVAPGVTVEIEEVPGGVAFDQDVVVVVAQTDRAIVVRTRLGGLVATELEKNDVPLD